MNNYYLITFENTHSAMNGESILKSNNIKNIVMPTPTSITKSCGICLKIDEGEINKVIALVKENKMKAKNIYKKEEANFHIVEI